MPSHLYGFKKNERLCSKVQIAELFKTGNSFVVYPFRVVWRESDEKREIPVQTAFSVAKRKIRLAVNRNLLKRRMREAYRIRKNELYSRYSDVSLDLMIIYLSSDIKDYGCIDGAMNRIIENLVNAKVVDKNNDTSR